MNIKTHHSILVILFILSLLLCSTSHADSVSPTDETNTSSEVLTDEPGAEPVDSDMSVSAGQTSDTPESEYQISETDSTDEETAILMEEPEPVDDMMTESDAVAETGTPEKLDSSAGIYYTVKKGDTLWDLSRRFNNDSWKWPGMWSDNKELTNPHRIYPGQKLKLFYRKDIEVIKSIEDKVEAEEIADTSESIEEYPDVVEPEEDDKIVDGVDPVNIEETPEADTEPEGPIKLPFYHYSKMDSAGFMKKEPADSHGYIFKVKGIDRIMLSKGDEVYIKETGDIPLTPGAKYFSYKTKKPSYIKKKLKEQRRFLGIKTKSVKSSLVGTQHYLTGVIEITGKKSGYAVGKIIRSYKTVSLEDMLIPYVYRSPDITLASSVEGINGVIITSEEQEGRFADDKVAFINKGTNDGVKRGQMYNVFYPEEKASAELIGGQELFIPVDFASFLVIHAEETTATILITSAYQSVSAGDKWHYPQE